MKTILTSILLLILSILLVIGCEVIEKSIHDEDVSLSDSETVQDNRSTQSNDEFTTIKLDEEENIQEKKKQSTSES